MKLEITKEKVLEAASKCSTAKATLQTLFPECFDEVLIPEFEDIKTASGERLIENALRSNNKFWLSNEFDWDISKDPSGGFFLTPKPKSK